MQYSFLLVNYNMAGLVRQVVDNIARQCPTGDDYEIIVADNSSDPWQVLQQSAFDPSHRVTVLAIENRGFVDALNRLLPLAQGRFVMIMHPDIELTEGCLAALTAFLEIHPGAAAAGSDVEFLNGPRQRIRLKLPTVSAEAKSVANSFIGAATGKRPLRDDDFWNRASDAVTETIFSVCMLLRREALRQIGPIDPKLVFYHANDYLCSRARQLGWTCHYVQAARTIHFERHAPRDLYSASDVMEYKRSLIAANPRIRADFFQFTSHFYGWGSRLMLRALALLEDGLSLAMQFRRPRERWQNIRKLAESIRVDLGGSPDA